MKKHSSPHAKHSPKSHPKSRLIANPQPVFAQPQPLQTPPALKIRSPIRSEKEIANLEPVPKPSNGAVEPVLTLAQVYGSAGNAKVQALQQAGQIVFHSVGDTGSVLGPDTQSLVADKMVTDFDEQIPRMSRRSFSISETSSIISAKEPTTTTSSTSRFAIIQRQSSPFQAITMASSTPGTPLRRSSLSAQFLRGQSCAVARRRWTFADHDDRAGRVLHLRCAVCPHPGTL